uniref:Uncharacterized protein n=1 Tax=Romanomermis culicivorax TaxID=13658 RepID=A0A915HZS3_ROMCU
MKNIIQKRRPLDSLKGHLYLPFPTDGTRQNVAEQKGNFRSIHFSWTLPLVDSHKIAVILADRKCVFRLNVSIYDPFLSVPSEKGKGDTAQYQAAPCWPAPLFSMDRTNGAARCNAVPPGELALFLT